MTVIVGQIATADGTGYQPAWAGEPMLAYRSSSTAYNPRQPARIPVDIAHEPGTECGEVVYLAQRQLGLFAVAEVDDRVAEVLPDEFFLSAESLGRFDGDEFSDTTLCGVAICAKSATVGKSPATIVEGGIEDSFLYHRNAHLRPLLKEAADYQGRRLRLPSDTEHHIDPLPISCREVTHLVGGGVLIDGEPVPVTSRGAQRYVSVPDGYGGTIRAPLEHRRGGKILSVR